MSDTAVSDLLQHVVENSCEWVMAFDAGGSLVMASDRTLRLLGWTAAAGALPDLQQVLARLREGLVDPDQDGCPWLAPQARPFRRTVRLYLAQPGRPALSLECRLVGLAEGNTLIYLRDISSEIRMERQKAEFVTTAAHELRTPMVSIFGFSELLASRPVPEQRLRQGLQLIHKHAKLVNGMVNDLLELSVLDLSLERELTLACAATTSLVEDVLRRFDQHPGRKRIRFLPCAPDHTLWVDVDKVLSAVTKVVSNALKYSPHGGPVTIDLVDGEIDGKAACGVRVADTGQGMTPEHIEHMFERFYRADPSGTVLGTGLGLSIVQRIVQLHQGRIEVSIRLHKGTVVTLWFLKAQS